MNIYTITAPTDGWMQATSSNGEGRTLYFTSVYIPLDDLHRICVVLHRDPAHHDKPYIYGAMMEERHEEESGWFETGEMIPNSNIVLAGQ